MDSYPRFIPIGSDFRSYMIEYIREHFGDALGPHAKLLDQEGGLDRLAELAQSGKLTLS